MDTENNGSKLSDLADLLTSWRMSKEHHEEELKKANEKIRATEQLIVAKMQEEDIEKFAHNGSLFFPRVESHPTVNKEKEYEFFEWLHFHNEDGIVKPTIHPSTLKAWWKANSDRFAEEITEREFLKVFEEIRISVRKAS